MSLVSEIERLIADNQYHAARRAVEQLESLPPAMLNEDERELLMYQAGRVRLLIGDATLAEVLLARYLRDYRATGRWIAGALLNLGIAVAYLNRPQAALQFWGEALGLNPPPAVRWRLLHSRAWAFTELGDTRQARADIEALRTHAEDPGDHLDVLLCEGFVALADCAPADAIQRANRLLESPDADSRQRAHALWIAAEAGLMTGRIDEARALAVEARRLSLHPPRPWLLNRVSQLLSRLPSEEKGVS